MFLYLICLALTWSAWICPTWWWKFGKTAVNFRVWWPTSDNLMYRSSLMVTFLPYMTHGLSHGHLILKVVFPLKVLKSIVVVITFLLFLSLVCCHICECLSFFWLKLFDYFSFFISSFLLIDLLFIYNVYLFHISPLVCTNFLFSQRSKTS